MESPVQSQPESPLTPAYLVSFPTAIGVGRALGLDDDEIKDALDGVRWRPRGRLGAAE